MNSLNPVDKLNNIISELTAISDFFKRIGDDSHLVEEQTPMGLHLFMGDCIDGLKEVGQYLSQS